MKPWICIDWIGVGERGFQAFSLSSAWRSPGQDGKAKLAKSRGVLSHWSLGERRNCREAVVLSAWLSAIGDAGCLECSFSLLYNCIVMKKNAPIMLIEGRCNSSCTWYYKQITGSFYYMAAWCIVTAPLNASVCCMQSLQSLHWCHMENCCFPKPPKDAFLLSRRTHSTPEF